MKKFVIEYPKDFNLEHILECGQCFRWKKEEDSSYTGVLKSGVVNVKITAPHQLTVKSELIGNDVTIIRQYFDIDRDYAKIKKMILKNDKNMQLAVRYGYGIRILKQDPWEMLISFIISAANNIPRISKTIENISKAYGKKVMFEGRDYYLFPSPNELKKTTIEELRNLNLGFRDKYVYEAVQKVVSKEINLEKIKNMDYEDAKKELMKISGVGAKVADCILLFSMEKMEAFPIDTWIKKVMTQLYGTKSSQKSIEKCAQTKFGAFAGIAQQYLFYYMRENH